MNKEMVLPSSFQGKQHIGVFGIRVSDVSEWLFIAGTVPRDGNNIVVGKNDIKKQIVKVFENLRDILRAGGASLKDIVHLNVYITDEKLRNHYLEFSRKNFGDCLFAQTILVVKGLNDPEVLIEADGIACINISSDS
jgi:enamine deaminase RidA (YjgF/YER057c/UK114 family)